MASSVVVAPSVGHALNLTQGGIGATPGYDAIDFRRYFGAPLQEGALDASTYKVHERNAGANMQVEVDANAGEGVLVQGDTLTNSNQGRYHVAQHGTVITLDAFAASVANPRIDSVVLRVRDSTHDGSGQFDPICEYLQGTATSGATLDNAVGRPALPQSAVRLCDILMPTSATSVTAARIRDRRPIARGQYYRGYTETSLTGTGGAAKQVPANCTFRGEFTGAPVRITLRHGFITVAAAAPSYGIRVMPIFDSVTPGAPGAGGAGPHAIYLGHFSPATADFTSLPGATHVMGWVPTAGSHQVEFAFILDNFAVGGQVIQGPFEMIIEELPQRTASLTTV